MDPINVSFLKFYFPRSPGSILRARSLRRETCELKKIKTKAISSKQKY